jgi:transposase
MLDKDIPKYYPKINELSNSFLKLFGPKFTNSKEGHIETDIAGSSSIAGLMLLRDVVHDLDKYKPGSVILSEVYEGQNDLLHFMGNVAYSLGLAEPTKGWNTKIPKGNEPIYSTLELTSKLEKSFIEICKKVEIDRKYYAYIAALTSIKLVSAGQKMKILDLNIGKAIAFYNVIAGSKTVPNNL